MRVFNARRNDGTSLENLYLQGYRKGRREQLEHDVSMLENLIEMSQDCNEFMKGLTEELKRISRGVEKQI